MKHAHRFALGARLPSAWLLRLCQILIFLVTLLGVPPLAGPAAAAPEAAPADSCNWSGATTLWSDTDNWSCGHVPQSGDDVTIGSGAKQPFLNAAATIATLNLDGGWLTMNGSGSLTVTGAAQVTGQSHITNDGQYSAASTTVQFGAELIAAASAPSAAPLSSSWAPYSSRLPAAC